MSKEKLKETLKADILKLEKIKKEFEDISKFYQNEADFILTFDEVDRSLSKAIMKLKDKLAGILVKEYLEKK